MLLGLGTSHVTTTQKSAGRCSCFRGSSVILDTHYLTPHTLHHGPTQKEQDAPEGTGERRDRGESQSSASQTSKLTLQESVPKSFVVKVGSTAGW